MVHLGNLYAFTNTESDNYYLISDTYHQHNVFECQFCATFQVAALDNKTQWQIRVQNCQMCNCNDFSVTLKLF